MNISNNDKILVIAPHPDDESIGTGGLLALYGSQCDVLLLTDGRHGHQQNRNIDENELIDLRQKEIKCATTIANVHQLICLNIEDRMVYRNKDKLLSFDIKRYNYIFLPNRYETHIDHCVVYPLIKKMIVKQNAIAKLYEYEIWTTLRSPTDFLDISNVIDIKKRMIGCHKTQLVDCNYIEKGISLSNYRGIYVNCRYAEAFTESRKMHKNELKQLLPFFLILKIRNIRRIIKENLAILYMIKIL